MNLYVAMMTNQKKIEICNILLHYIIKTRFSHLNFFLKNPKRISNCLFITKCIFSRNWHFVFCFVPFSHTFSIMSCIMFEVWTQFQIKKWNRSVWQESLCQKDFFITLPKLFNVQIFQTISKVFTSNLIW
jgi:hypothetical protein